MRSVAKRSAVAVVVVVAVFVFADAAVVQNGAVRAALFVRGGVVAVSGGGGGSGGVCRGLCLRACASCLLLGDQPLPFERLYSVELPLSCCFLFCQPNVVSPEFSFRHRSG